MSCCCMQCFFIRGGPFLGLALSCQRTAEDWQTGWESEGLALRSAGLLGYRRSNLHFKTTLTTDAAAAMYKVQCPSRSSRLNETHLLFCFNETGFPQMPPKSHARFLWKPLAGKRLDLHFRRMIAQGKLTALAVEKKPFLAPFAFHLYLLLFLLFSRSLMIFRHANW